MQTRAGMAALRQHSENVISDCAHAECIEHKENTAMATGKPTICFIGFGEAGQAIASGSARGRHRTDRRLGHSFPGPGRRKTERRRCSDRRALRHLGGRCGARRRRDHFGGDGGIERRCGPIGQAAPRAAAVLPRHQFGLARPQAGNRKAPWRHGALCRCRGAGADSSGAPSDADAARRPACGRDRPRDSRARYASRASPAARSVRRRPSRWCAAS